VQTISNGKRAKSSASSARPAPRLWRLATGLAASLTALGLVAGFPAAASAAAPPPPAPGIAPGAVAEGAGLVDLFYTAADGTVWTRLAGGTPGALQQVSDGKVVSAVSGFFGAGVVALFGEAADHQLWWTTRVSGKWAPWSSLGGNVTSQPGAVFRGPFDYSVYVRGGNGAVWARDHTTAGWNAWHSIGGNLLSGTGPSAAFLGSTFVLVVGTNRQLYLSQVGVTGFTPAGGATTADPALTVIPGALVGFVRGTDNAGYYHRFLSTSAGWHSMAGTLATGLAAAAAGSVTYTFGLGPDSQVYRNIGTWTTYPPKLTGWTKVTG
jgi:hypothetical protein